MQRGQKAPIALLEIQQTYVPLVSDPTGEPGGLEEDALACCSKPRC